MTIVKIKEIKEHPENPRQHTDEQIDKIARSIKELGWGRPIILSKDGYILAGHGAYLASLKLGLKEVPVSYMAHEHNTAEAKAYMVADNRLTDESDWNYGKLEPLIEDVKIQGFDVTLTGFDQEEIDNLMTGLNFGTDIDLEDFETIPEKKAKTTTCPKCGETYELDN